MKPSVTASSFSLIVALLGGDRFDRQQPPNHFGLFVVTEDLVTCAQCVKLYTSCGDETYESAFCSCASQEAG